MPANVIWKPHPGPQTWLMLCGVESILFGGARGGGKTDSALAKVVQHADRWKSHCRALWIRQTFPQLEEAMERANELYPPIGAQYRAGMRMWTFPGGGWLKFRSMMNDSKAADFQGKSHSLIVVDEAGTFPEPDPLDKLWATARSAAGVPVQMILTANPGGPGHQWLKGRFVQDHPPLRPFVDPVTGIRRVFIPSKLQDNPSLLKNDPDYVKRLRGSGPAWLVKAWLEGDWNATLVGKMIQLSWFQRYDVPPPYERYSRLIMSVDCANKPNAWNDWSVISVWGECDGQIYLLDVWREKVQIGGLESAVTAWAGTWRPHAILIEDKGNGQALIQRLREDTRFAHSVIAIEPLVGKELRMAAETDQIQGLPPPPVLDSVEANLDDMDELAHAQQMVNEAGALHAGRVWIPAANASTTPPWLPGFETEVALFPEIKEKDQVDTMSQALWYFRTTDGSGPFQFDFVGPGVKSRTNFRFGR